MGLPEQIRFGLAIMLLVTASRPLTLRLLFPPAFVWRYDGILINVWVLPLFGQEPGVRFRCGLTPLIVPRLLP